MIGVGPPDCCDRQRASALEWLEVDGRGGFASGTVSGQPTRRFHGLLLIAAHPPHARTMLVTHLSEWLEIDATWVALSSCEQASPAEDGYRHCRGFQAGPLPEWQYEIGDLTIIRSILCPRGGDAVLVCWRLLRATPGAGAPRVRLHVRPMLTGRAVGDVMTADAGASGVAERHAHGVSWQPWPQHPRVYASGEFTYRNEPSWRRGVVYAVDRDRGEPWREDWWSPGELTFDLTDDRPAALLRLSTDGGRHLTPDGLLALFKGEVVRRQASCERQPESGDSLFDQLAGSIDSHLVEMGDRAAVVAGFPFFNVWTRDAFTAVGGLFLATERAPTALRILRTFAPLVDGGILPNDLPDAVTAPRWTSADASLWFIVAAGRYAERTGDAAALRAEVWPAMRAIVDGYCRGTAHVTVRVDGDGLVFATSDTTPLTWMDAEFEGRVMTPRRGKPVEVQALWVRALGVAAALAGGFGDAPYAAACEARRAQAIASFRRRFWWEAGQYLYDVVDGPGGDDPTLRPNQLFALTLDRALCPDDWAARALAVVHDRLLTPRGLRTVPVDDPAFHPVYAGDRAHRDLAYHQGTVWPYLLGPFVSAWLRVHGPGSDSRRQARAFLDGIEEHIRTEGCLGHVSEIFDGAAPHRARGCFAQAWSLGEILLALDEIQAARKRPSVGGG